MQWARSNTFRGLVVGMLVVFVVIQGTERAWVWLGIGTALLVLNLVSWRRQHGRGATHPQAAPRHAPSRHATTRASTCLLMPDGVDATLSELLERSPVQQAWNTGPAVWRQVSYLEDRDDLELRADEVADYVWISTYDDETIAQTQAHWAVGVGDELKPLLDLDVPEEEDPLVAMLASHPSVAEAVHSDREQYHVVLRAPITLDDMAALAARGLIAHHLDAVRRLRPDVHL